MDGMSAQAQEVRRNYKRQYRIRNREKINSQQRMWRKKNPDKVKEYQAQYWERRAQRENTRASYGDYGITQERLEELWEIAISGKHDDLVRSAAHTANQDLAEYIPLSVTQNKSYDALEKLWARGEIGKIPYGKTDFYGARRLFFHYLDCALKNNKNLQEDGVNE